MRSMMAVAAGLVMLAPGCAAIAPRDAAIPRYDHVAIIIEENKDYDQILSPAAAPNIARLAAAYGNATQFYAEVHPSEGNYVAMLGGDTIGIHDDDAFYCKPGQVDPFCAGSTQPGYRDHTSYGQHLGGQIAARGLTWKGYYEDIPAPGSLAVIASIPKWDDGSATTPVYASKHSGFVNFASVQKDPQRAQRLVGFDQLDADLASGALPNLALIVPNQCNEMHGIAGPNVPADCKAGNPAGLIARGDAVVGRLVERLQATAAWRSNRNMAIIVTFDEGAGRTREGCCGITPGEISNFGGGHIPTIVITNHGPRGVSDPTPYSHYSLLRTLEDAFGVSGRLGHAADTDRGVVAMAPLFATRSPAP
jgi:hypothetical protein